MHFGAPPFASASKKDRNYSIFIKNIEAFWRLHPCVRNLKESLDEDVKALLTSMLVCHPFFTKESDLVDAVANMWTDTESLFAQFREQLA